MGAHAADEGAGRIERIDLKGDGSSTKVIIMLSRPIAFDVRVLDGDAAQKTARRLVLDFGNTTLAPEVTKPIDVGNALLRQVRTGQFNAETARIVLELTREATHSVEAFESPPHVTIALAGPGSMGAPSTGASDAPKPSAKTIPIRARWRKPYSLLFPR
jgi:N-acetylmuramoyl-L-alanine amidase